MNRAIGGLPLIYWIAGLGLGIGAFVWIKKKGAATGTASPATAGKASPNAFTQAQEVEDFQVFSALTGAQQASDLNFLSEVAGLFSGGSSTASTGSTASGGGGTSGVSSPPATGTAPPGIAPYVTGTANSQGLYQITNPGESLAAGQAGLPVYEQATTGQYVSTSAFPGSGLTPSPNTAQYLAP